MMRSCLPLLLFIFYFQASYSVEAGNTNASIRPEQTRVEYLNNPLGLDLAKPRLGWILKATDTSAFGQRQTAYRLWVASSRDLLDQSSADMWDTGWVRTDESQHITYDGKPLQSDRTYYWKVQVKDEKGEMSAWSEVARWSTGWFDQQEWKAKWIGADEAYDRAAKNNNITDPWFRKAFQLERTPGRAFIYLASVGYHELFVNGEKVGREVLAPAATDHTKRARYVVYDVTDKLKPGKNAIGIWAGTSWSIFPPYIAGQPWPATPVVSACMTVYAESDPTRGVRPALTLLTDESWKTHPSSSRLLGKWDFQKMGGEIVDARNYIPGWNQSSFDDSDWETATEYPVDLTLSAQAVEGNRLFEQIRPVAMEVRKDGSYRVDMGVNFAGWTEVSLKAKEGDTIRFMYSERPEADITYNLHSAYVVDSSGKGVFRNRFNYSSGRWITIVGLKQPPQLEDVRGWMVRTNFSNATQFSCSDSLQNWIYDRVRWTFENLSLGGYIVDCPQRERMGYGGDAHATSETGMFNYQLGAFYTKWMEDWRDVQGTETVVGDMLDDQHARKKLSSGRILNNGQLPHTAPTYWGGGGPAWGGIVVVLPWFMYQHYGDTRVLTENFKLISDWLSFLETHRKRNLLRRFGAKWDFLGDWLWPNANAEGMNNDKPETVCFNNSYYVFKLRTAAKIARVIGRHAEADKWEKQAIATAKAVHTRFFNKKDFSYADGSMANLATALLAEIPADNIRQQVWERLEHEIMVVRKGHIHAGITGGALLFKLLRDEGRDDLIYSMVSKTTYPGWGHMKENGATTIWEAWENSLKGHSKLHSSYLYPGAWYIDGAAGIRRDPQYPGFRRFIVRPPAPGTTGLSWAKANFRSPAGIIISDWSREEGKLKIRITVPPNSTASLQVLPSEELNISEYPGVKREYTENGYLQYEIGPGTYQLISL